MSCILVIEGNTGVRKIISEFLTNSGHEVLNAKNGKVGLEKCSETVDFVITALLMPEKDGLEVIAEVKSKWPDIKIICLDAVWDHAPDIDFFKIAKMLGASYVLKQPVNLPEVLQVINCLRMPKRTG